MRSLFRGIGWRIFVSFTTLLGVLLVILMVAGWRYLESTAFDNAANELRVQSITMVQQLQRDLTRIENTIRILGSDGGRISEFVGLYDIQKEKLRNYLSKRVTQTPLFEAFAVYDLDGNLVTSTDPEWSKKSVINESFFQAALKKVSFSEVFEDPNYAEIDLWVAGPIGETKLHRGVLVGKIRLSQIYELMALKLGLTGETEAFLVDSKLRFVTPAKNAPSDELLQSHLALTPLINHLQDEFWVGRYKNYKDVEVLGTVRRTQGYDGFLVIEKEYTEVEKHLNFLKRILFSTFAFLLIALTLTTVLITKSITSPVQSLVDSAQRIAGGDLSHPVEIPKGADEISFLAMEFDRMRDRVATYQKQLHERLEVSEQKRVESERLAAIGTLAASMAHEIRNPLNGMSLLLAQLERSPRAEDRDRTLVAGIRAEIGRLDRLVSDILDYARPLQLQKDSVNIDELVDEVLQFYEPTFQSRRIHVRRVPGFNSLITRADRDKLRQAIMNVIQNAMDATPTTGGRLEVSTQVENDDVVIVITDQGAGIPESIKPRLFDLFFSTKDKGNGLGLSTVRKIMDAHAGSIEIASHVGYGTTVRLQLPLVS